MSAKKTAKKPAKKSSKGAKAPRGLTHEVVEAAHQADVELLTKAQLQVKEDPPSPEDARAKAENWFEKPATAEEAQRLLLKELRWVLAHESEITPMGPGTGFSVNSPIASSGNRMHVTKRALRVYDAQHGQPEGIGEWFVLLMNLAPSALLEAAAELAGYADPADLEANRLSAVGNIVSRVLKKKLLLVMLQRYEWNLTRVSEELRAGGAGSIVRLIRDLGLSEEYRTARRAGAGKPGPKARA